MTPQVSVVIRSFNEQRHIGDVLKAVRNQTIQNVQIILVDSGSTDQTVAIARPYCDKVLSIDSRDFTFGFSLNFGCRHSDGDIVVFLSAHAIPTDTHWLERLIAPLTDPAVAMVYGRHLGVGATKHSERRDFAHTFKPTPRRHDGSDGVYANNANAAIRRSAWAITSFDEYLPGLEDIAWARHVASRGLVIVYEPQAAVYHIHDETWTQIYNRYRREAVAARRIGLAQPLHASRSPLRLITNIAADVVTGVPSLSASRIREIVGFRYYQWLGTRDGWTKEVDLRKERYSLYYSGSNQGVIILGRERAVFQELPMPEVRPGDVLIRVAYVGVCRTDLEVFEGALGYYKQGIARYPIIPGHEYSGTVVHVGANGHQFEAGDIVVGECLLACGVCEACAAGRPAGCPRRLEVGVVNRNGAYAHYLSLPAQHVHKVPHGINPMAAVLTEPLAVVHKGIRRLGIRLQPGKRCAVVGAGPIGNLSAQVLAMSGSPVTVFDVNAARLAALNGNVRAATSLEGLSEFDVVVEATGRAEVLARVLAESRADATLLLFGLPYGPSEFNFESVVAQERVIVGSVGGASEDFAWALQHLPRLELQPFLRHIVPLERYAEAWQLCRSGDALKVILRVE